MTPIPHKLQTQVLPALAVLLLLFFTACDDSGTGPDNEKESQIETYIVEDIPADTASTGQYTFYSLRENSIVEDSASTDWDIALAGTTILTNGGVSGPGEGGAVILDVPFEEVTIAPSEGYKVDTDTLLAIPTGGDNGWYHYTSRQPPQHAILPLENKTIVLKTGDGESYAKLRIISYYKGNPDTSSDEFANSQTRPPDQFYTFEYVIQLNGSRELQ